ncbi:MULTISPECIES: DUF4190 domain-containing protein [unclassified Microbacterium]|uniref:DUF4190 domain-containing protein n=1 Tax=unclassified Microbacterium TaxID=2609290 RepID=UPI00214B56D9|nr:MULTISPECIES: DUF4190 domain-containing protein [unclassified Microbacterium]MCR2783851.1 DUF4190 domain-containing protein [Microbacterium sp. zg.B96]WIM15302.1 DUF4190 domain-containing protein [Microbacterium sp. zg-B96]
MTAVTVPPAAGWDSADAWTALHRAETTAHDLAAIAAAYPDYAEQIAEHPQAYPALIEWAGIVAATRRPPRTPGSPPQVAGLTDLIAGRRRDSGAHPLAYSADAAAWRAAVAAGSARGQSADAAPGAVRPVTAIGRLVTDAGRPLTEAGRPMTEAVRLVTDAAADRVPWTPAGVEDAAADATVSTAELAAARAAAAALSVTAAEPQPWWVTDASAPGDALDAAAAHTMHRADFAPVGPQRAEAIAVGSAAGEAAAKAQSAVPERPALPNRSAADAAGSYPVASAPASAVAAAVNAKALLALVFAFVLAPLGIVFGHLALREVAATGEPGRGYARAGLVVGYALAALTVAAATMTALVLLLG